MPLCHYYFWRSYINTPTQPEIPDGVEKEADARDTMTTDDNAEASMNGPSAAKKIRKCGEYLFATRIIIRRSTTEEPITCTM